MTEESAAANGQAAEPGVEATDGSVGLLTRLDELVRSAEEASRKANSEALFAFNAKEACEAHATTISQIKGTVEAEASWLTTTRKSMEENAQAASVAKKDAEDGARAVGTAKTDVDNSVVAVRANQEKSQGLLSAIEAAQVEVAAAKQKVSDIASEASQAKATVETQAAAVQAQHNQVGETAAKVKVDGAAVASDKARADAVLVELEAVRETARTAQAKVTEYEDELIRLRRDFDGLHSQIEMLLPGATSAGLASAFQTQKSRFDLPQWVSLGVFLVTVVVLALVGWAQVEAVKEASGGSVAEWDLILRHITNRLLLVGPLVWIALVAQRSYNSARRVQEDYAFKEAVSRSFEGYKREMASLPVSSEQVAPLLRLCENVLTTLSQRPGRLYEGKHDDITPLTPVLKTVTDLATRLGDVVKIKKDVP